MYKQHYRVGKKQFTNAYAGLYESAKTQMFCETVIPEYHIENFLRVDLESLKQYTSHDLIKQKLCILRDEYNSIRFHYTGGSDSHTIMLAAQELGIKFDCVFTLSNSVNQDPNIEYEYVNGIQYAQTTGMNYIVHRPSIQDFESVWFDKWCFTKYNDFYHGFVPGYSDIFLSKYENKNYLELVGFDKPRYYCKDNRYYWLLHDTPDYCTYQLHEDFYVGSIFPELAVKQVVKGLEYIKKFHPTKQGFINHKDMNVNKFCSYLGLNNGIDNKIRKTNKDHWKFGYLNEKHKRSLKQLVDLGRRDIVDAWINVSEFILNSVEAAPYGIEKRHVLLPEIDSRVWLTTNTIRIGAIFEILDNKLELVPHTDIGKL